MILDVDCKIIFKLVNTGGCCGDGDTYVENHEDAYELGEAKGDTKFERGKSRDHSSTSLP